MGRIILPEGILILIQTAAIVISATAAVVLVLQSRAQTKRRATVEMILTMRMDYDYITLRNSFTQLIKKEENLVQYANEQHREDENYMLILRVLNYYEFIATGIFENAFDEEVCKRMTYNMCMRDWERLHEFVYKIRTSENMATLFQEFELLVRIWRQKPLKKRF